MKNLKLIQKCILLIALLSVSSWSYSQDDELLVHDPVVIKQADTYYLFCTGLGISCYSSTDLKNWKHVPAVFPEKPVWADGVAADFKNHIWAPDITFYNNQYYLYYSVSAFAKNTSAIGLVTNKTLNPSDKDFKWEDQGIVIQSIPNRDLWNAIDPNLVFDENNTPWLSFGSFWNGMKQVRLSADLKSVAQPQEWYTLARRERSFDLKDTNPGDAAIEAPFIFKKNGFYYLFVSWDYCCRGENSTYKVVYGRSENANGPFLDKTGKDMNQGGGTILLEGNEEYYGIGHNSAYTFEGKDYLFSHAYSIKKKGAPILKVMEMSWDKDFWIMLK